MNAVLKPYLSFKDYLAAEELAVEKSEYYAGETFTMAGGTINHNLIAGNTHFALKMVLKNKPCKVFIGDVKLYISKVDISTYPDVFVIEGQPEYWENRHDVLCNAALIVEVLSNSTQDYDRAGKFDIYCELPSFTDYILIHQNRIKVEYRIKQSQHQWLLTEYTDLNDIIILEKFGTQLTVADIYENIEFV